MKTILYTVALLPLLLVYSRPINIICVPVCSPNVTANEPRTLLNQWLGNDQSTGIDQLLNHKGTVIRTLISLSSTDVSILHLIESVVVTYPQNYSVHFVKSQPKPQFSQKSKFYP